MGNKYDEHKRALEIISVFKKHEVVGHGITTEKLHMEVTPMPVERV